MTTACDHVFIGLGTSIICGKCALSAEDVGASENSERDCSVCGSTHSDDSEALSCLSKAWRLQSMEIARLQNVVTKVERIMKARDARHERTKAFQDAARAARLGGPSGRSVIAALEAKHPIAHDIGDLVDDLVEALEKAR